MPAFFSLGDAARLLGLKRDTIQWHLRKRPELFSEPRYRRLGGHPRLHRVLTLEDVTTLMRLILRPMPAGWMRQRKARGSANQEREMAAREETGAGR